MSNVDVIEAPHGVPASTIGMLATGDLRVVAMVMPTGSETDNGIAAELLHALGKNEKVNGKARHRSDAAYLVPIWLTAHRTETLYAIAPQHTNDKAVAALIRMCASTPTQLVFVCDNTYAPRFTRSVRHASPEPLPWPDTNQLLEPDEEPFTGWDPNHRELLPDDEYFTFYSTCERLLPQAMFEDVDRLYRESLSRTLHWLDLTGPDNITEASVTEAMKVLTGDQKNTSEVTVALRAAQAAFHRNGWHLTYDDNVIRHHLLRFPPANPTLTTWRSLRAYREPARAANTAIYLCGLTVDEISKLTLEDLANWHANEEHISGHTIHTEARPFLRAHLYNTLVRDPNPKSLLTGGSNNRVRSDIRDAASDLGVDIGDAVLQSDQSHQNRHLKNRPFRIERYT